MRGATKPRRLYEWLERNRARGVDTTIRLKDGRSFLADRFDYNSFNHHGEFTLHGKMVADGVLVSQVEDVPSTSDLWPAEYRRD